MLIDGGSMLPCRHILCPPRRYADAALMLFAIAAASAAAAADAAATRRHDAAMIPLHFADRRHDILLPLMSLRDISAMPRLPLR